MFELILGLAVFISLLLMVVILAQNPKGGGLSSAFGGSGASQVIGVKKTGDLLEKLTWGFAVALVVLTLASAAVVEPINRTNAITSPNVESAEGAAAINPELQTQPTEGDAAGEGLDDLIEEDPQEGGSEDPANEQ